MSNYFTIITGYDKVDQVGFHARRAGLTVRDCICIQRPEGPVFALLVREPMETTVVEEVVRHGTGALDIDSARISTTDSLDGGDTSSGRRGEGGDRPWMHDEERLAERRVEAKERVQKAQNLGRWPANMVLVHGEECECVGTKKVKPSNGSGTAHQDNKVATNRVYAGPLSVDGVSGKAGYAGEDGKEEVANWHCQPGCPVTLLDMQSFAMGIHGAGHATRYTTKGGYVASSYDMSGAREVTRYGDSGGASRFFYQATSLDDLESYLVRLTGNSPEYSK